MNSLHIVYCPDSRKSQYPPLPELRALYAFLLLSNNSKERGSKGTVLLAEELTSDSGSLRSVSSCYKPLHCDFK